MKHCLAVLSILLLGSACFATTYYVPDDYATVQEAINACVAYDSVVIAPGEYAGFYVVGGPSNLTILGAGAFCDDPTVLLQSPANPIHSCVWIQNVNDWEVGEFTTKNPSSQDASGIELWNADGCRLHHVDVAEVENPDGLGLLIQGCDNTTVERSLIRAGNYDVVGLWYYVSNTNLTLRNLTVSGDGNGILNRSSQPGLHITNCLAYMNGGTGFQISYYQSSYVIQYNDSWGNYGSNYYGFTPGPTNLSVNPLLAGGTGWQAFELTENSPMIDAGDPNGPLDPDGTTADIGCFYYDQGPGLGTAALDLEPVNPPVIIPVEGDTFSYSATLSCDTAGWTTVDAWADLRLPNGLIMGPLYVYSTVHMDAGDTIFRQLQMYVSMWAMPGTYWFRGFLGDYSSQTVVASDSFSFVKEETAGFKGSGEAYLEITGWGDPVRVELPAAALPQAMALSAYPNPFNPSTALSYQLQATSQVRLTVWDTAGRLVATLVNGVQEAGQHSITFDGSKLASGVYLVRLTAGAQTQVQKMVLMK